MSDHVTQSYHGSGAMAAEPVHRCEAVWMAHWMRTSCKSATQACSNLPVRYESKEEVHDTKRLPMLSGSKIATDIYAKGFREETKVKAVDTISENLTSSKKLRRERLDFQPFPMFSISQKREGIVALKNVKAMFNGEVTGDSKSGHNTVSLYRSESHLPLKCARDPPETDTLECSFQHGGISHYSEQQVKSHKDLELNSLPVSTSLQDDFMRSSIKIVPYGFDSIRAPFQSFMSRQEEINHQSNYVMASKECVPDTNYFRSPFLVHENKICKLLDSRTHGKPLLMQKDAVHDPSTSSHQQADFVGKKCLNMQNHSVMELFPSRSSPPEVSKSEKLHHGCHSLPRLPCSVHDVETMRIYTTVDSMKGSSRVPSKFSETTRHFLITKKTDVDLSDGCQMFRESTVSTKFKGKPFSELLGLSPDLQFHVQQGVELQPLESSTDSHRKENFRDAIVSVGSKNESSAETDTMDMDAFQEKYPSSVASSPSNKYLKGMSPTAQGADASVREEMGNRLLNRELYDKNQAFADLPALTSPVRCGEASTSRTQSLDAENLLSHAEQAIIPKPESGPEVTLGPDPSSRWVKRLKLSGSKSAYGTKCSKMGQASSHEKVNKFFSKILRCGITSSEPTESKSHGKEQMEDQNAMFLRNDESSSIETVKESLSVTLSHPWIQRWCHKRTASPQTKPEAVVVCEPKCSKAGYEFQKKKFPSIAAMALMGKAICGFHPCEFRKRGSFVVWNTKGVLR